jgi:hypothetical protein
MTPKTIESSDDQTNGAQNRAQKNLVRMTPRQPYFAGGCAKLIPLKRWFRRIGCTGIDVIEKILRIEHIFPCL